MADAEPGDEPTRKRLTDRADRRAVLSGSRPQMLAMPVATTSDGRAEQHRRPGERLLATRRLAEPERARSRVARALAALRGRRRREAVAAEPHTDPPKRIEKSYMKSCTRSGSRADCAQQECADEREGVRCDEVRASRVQRSARRRVRRRVQRLVRRPRAGDPRRRRLGRRPPATGSSPRRRRRVRRLPLPVAVRARRARPTWRSPTSPRPGWATPTRTST